MDKVQMSLKRKPSISKPQRLQRNRIPMKTTKRDVDVIIRDDANITEVDPIANLLDPDRK